MNWKGKAVLVTGGGGFIGNHLVEKLVTLGAKTRALVRTIRAARGLARRVCGGEGSRVIAGDICDPDSVAAATREPRSSSICGADRHSLQLHGAGIVCAHQRSGHAQRLASRARI